MVTDYAEAHNKKGTALFDLGKYDETIEAYDEADTAFTAKSKELGVTEPTN